MRNILFSVRFKTYRNGNLLNWDDFSAKINGAINEGRTTSFDVYFEPPMTKNLTDAWASSIEEMIKVKHNCKVDCLNNNITWGQGLYSDEIKEITYYFAFSID